MSKLEVNQVSFLLYQGLLLNEATPYILLHWEEFDAAGSLASSSCRLMSGGQEKKDISHLKT